jgi:hypothetical protein
MMRKKIACVALATMGLSLFTACDEEITNTVTEKTSIGSIDKFKDLEKCEEDVTGQMVYVKDSTKIFACTSDGWISLNGADGANGENGTSCSAKETKEGIEVSCGNKVVGTIKNGEKGKAGTSCTAKANADESKLEVYCDGTLVGTIANGTNGKSAYELSGTDKTLDEWLASLKGENGESCTVKENTDEDGYNIECGGKKVGFIKNGTDGKSAFEIAQESDESVKKMTKEEWLASLKGESGESCTAKENTDEDGYDIECGGVKVGFIKNGTVGKSAFEIAQETDESVKNMTKEEWIASLKGKAGEGCTARENSNGVTITCGKDKVSLKNGEPCTIAENTSNSAYYTITCGNTSEDIAKALCNGTAYDPKIDYCNGIELEKCNKNDLWCKNTFYKVQTGKGNGTNTEGLWFTFDDHDLGTNSSITWPVETATEYETSALEPVIDYCMGLCGTLNLAQPEQQQPYSFVGIEFNIVGQQNNQTTEPAAGNVSDWDGICLYYTSDLRFLIKMSLGPEQDIDIEFNNPFVKLNESEYVAKRCFEWTDFQPEEDIPSVTPPNGAEAATKLVSLQFQFRNFGDTETNGNFNIIRITKYNNRPASKP